MTHGDTDMSVTVCHIWHQALVFWLKETPQYDSAADYAVLSQHVQPYLDTAELMKSA